MTIPPLDPGPPLVAGDEFCASAPPSQREYFRSLFFAGLVALVGAGLQFVAALVTDRVWGIATVVVGVAAGAVVNRAAGYHRSRILGALAAGATLISAAVGYGLTFMPFVQPSVHPRLDWYYLVMLGMALFIACLLAAPRTETPD